jgi:ubiquitin-like 1-activating enzyme E1 A
VFSITQTIGFSNLANSQKRAEAAVLQIRKLNNRVDVRADTSDVRAKDHIYMQNFDLIIATDLDYPTLSTINAACRLANKPFYAAGTHGFYGYIFADLIQHDYIVKSMPSNIEVKVGSKPDSTHSILAVQRKREDEKVWEIVEHRRLYSPLQLANTSPLHPFLQASRRRLRDVTPLLPCLRAMWEFETQFGRLPVPPHTPDDLRVFTTLATQKLKELGLPEEIMVAEFLRKFLGNIGSEIAPVTAMLGGLLSQDAINVIQHCEAPINNLCLFDGEAYKVPIYSLHPESFDVAANGSTSHTAEGPVARPKTPEGAIELD